MPPTRKTKQVTISNTDPESGIFRKGEHKVVFAYKAHTACDIHGYVLGSTVTPGNDHDSIAFDSLYNIIHEKYDEIEAIAADSAYTTPWICKRMIEDNIMPAMPYKRPNNRKGYFRSHEYKYDEDKDSVICPNNKILKYSTTDKDGYRIYRNNPQECINCPCAEKCTRSKDRRKRIYRHVWVKYVEQTKEIMKTPYARSVYACRKETIERVFGDAKENHGMRYTPYRGIQRVTKWVTLKYACMNLKKIALRDWSMHLSDFILCLFSNYHRFLKFTLAVSVG